MNRLEKILKKELDGNEEAVQSMLDHYNSCFDTLEKNEEKNISKAETEIQKLLTGIANEDPDDIIINIFNNIQEKDNSIMAIDKLERIKAYLFEEIQEVKKVQGFKKK